jgi:hypothetical protein
MKSKLRLILLRRNNNPTGVGVPQEHLMRNSLFGEGAAFKKNIRDNE